MTGIEWTDATWNPVVGCSVVSPGCANCYAMRMAGTRLRHTARYQGLTSASKAGPVWNGIVRLDEKALLKPLGWRKPRKVFVNSMGDVFHERVSEAWIDQVFAIMALCPQHQFQVLTKRPERMLAYLTGARRQQRVRSTLNDIAVPRNLGRPTLNWWPLPNVWVGTSVEDQARADERVPALLETPAAMRFLSCEPLLGPVGLERLEVDRDDDGPVFLDAFTGLPFVEGETGYGDQTRAVRCSVDGPDLARIDWVICGGESGPDARPMHPDWARSLRDQCQAAGVPFFFKQWGAWAAIGPAGSQSASEVIEEADDDRVAAVEPSGRLLDHRCECDHCWIMHRGGKTAAGRELDGRTWDQMPA